MGNLSISSNINSPFLNKGNKVNQASNSQALQKPQNLLETLNSMSVSQHRNPSLPPGAGSNLLIQA